MMPLLLSSGVKSLIWNSQPATFSKRSLAHTSLFKMQIDKNEYSETGKYETLAYVRHGINVAKYVYIQSRLKCDYVAFLR